MEFSIGQKSFGIDEVHIYDFFRFLGIIHSSQKKMTSFARETRQEILEKRFKHSQKIFVYDPHLEIDLPDIMLVADLWSTNDKMDKECCLLCFYADDVNCNIIDLIQDTLSQLDWNEISLLSEWG